ncbi:hypothetical protein C8R44DRAFT_985751 [Mycena epipterygia]|nr:hypothetical protein C8R44DRAFT_985751 [Mycena epipterygia]
MARRPSFPRELEREIVQITALTDASTIPPLLRVCHRVHIWVEPFLYRVILMNSEHTIAGIAAALDSKPSSFFEKNRAPSLARELLAPGARHQPCVDPDPSPDREYGPHGPALLLLGPRIPQQSRRKVREAGARSALHRLLCEASRKPHMRVRHPSHHSRPQKAGMVPMEAPRGPPCSHAPLSRARILTRNPPKSVDPVPQAPRCRQFVVPQTGSGGVCEKESLCPISRAN